MRLKEYLTVVCPVGYLNPKSNKWDIGGTGFFAVTSDHLPSGAQRIFFITAAHIIEKLYSQNLESVIGIAGGDARKTESLFIIKDRRKQIDFSLHPEHDIAFADVTDVVTTVTRLPTNMPNLDRDFLSLRDLRGEQVEEGSNIFLLGYPRGDNGGALLYPLVRGGVVANVRDVVSGLSFKAAIAATSAPGDSGGLVLAEMIAGNSGDLKILGTLVSYRVVEEMAGQEAVYGISDIVIGEVVKEHIRESLKQNLCASNLDRS